MRDRQKVNSLSACNAIGTPVTTTRVEPNEIFEELIRDRLLARSIFASAASNHLNCLTDFKVFRDAKVFCATARLLCFVVAVGRCLDCLLLLSLFFFVVGVVVIVCGGRCGVFGHISRQSGFAWAEIYCSVRACAFPRTHERKLNLIALMWAVLLSWSHLPASCLCVRA